MARNHFFNTTKLPKAFIPVFLVCFLFFTKGIRCDTQKLAISNEIGNSGPAPSLSSPSVSSNPNGNVNGQQYRQYYPVASDTVQNPWNRDSYANAAAEFGANNYQQPAQHSQGHSSSFFSNSDYGAEGNSFDVDGLGGFGGAGLGGLGGLAGILGIKGLKGLGLIGLLKLVGLPLLLLAVPFIILLPLLFFFLPVPVITLPADPNAGRTFGVFNFADISGKMTHLARSVLDSDKCIERLSCEMSSFSRGSLIDRALKKVIHRFETRMPQSLKRMARAYMEQPSPCNKSYSCYLIDESAKKST